MRNTNVIQVNLFVGVVKNAEIHVVVHFLFTINGNKRPLYSIVEAFLRSPWVIYNSFYTYCGLSLENYLMTEFLQVPSHDISGTFSSSLLLFCNLNSSDKDLTVDGVVTTLLA